MKKPKLTATIQSINYTVCLDGQCCDVCDLDWSGFAGEANDPYTLLKRAPGISDIEYNGHFGNYVYFTAESIAAKNQFLKVLADLLPRVNVWKKLIEDSYADR